MIVSSCDTYVTLLLTVCLLAFERDGIVHVHERDGQHILLYLAQVDLALTDHVVHDFWHMDDEEVVKHTKDGVRTKCLAL